MTRKEIHSNTDRREYLIEAVRKRRKAIRLKAIAYKGGSCEKCGYQKCFDALEFHHKDPIGKDFSISARGYTRSWERVKRELDKCILVCSNCLREIHAGTQLFRETGIEKAG